MDKKKVIFNDIILLLLSGVAVALFLYNSGTVLLLIMPVLLFLLILLNLESINYKYFLLLLVNIFSVIGTYLLHESAGVVLIFLTLFMSCLSFNYISFSKRIRKIVYFICYFGLLIMLLTASNIYKMYDWLVFIDRYGNLINNNTLGIYSVAFCFSSLLWNDLLNVKKQKKFLKIILFVVSFLFACLTGCRSAMLVLIIYFVLHMFIKTKLSNKAFRRITIIILLFSLLYPVIHVALYRILPDVIIFNKSLFSGREMIWIEAFQQIKDYPIFGSGTSLETDGFESVHNMLLGIWKNVGLIPCLSLISVYAINGRVSISHKQQIMLISILIFSFFESFMMDIKFLMLFALLMTGSSEINTIKENEVIKSDTKKNSLLLVWRKTFE